MGPPREDEGWRVGRGAAAARGQDRMGLEKGEGEGGLNERAGLGLGRGLLRVLGELLVVFAGPALLAAAAGRPGQTFPPRGPSSASCHLRLGPPQPPSRLAPPRARFALRTPLHSAVNSLRPPHCF